MGLRAMRVMVMGGLVLAMAAAPERAEAQLAAPAVWAPVASGTSSVDVVPFSDAAPDVEAAGLVSELLEGWSSLRVMPAARPLAAVDVELRDELMAMAQSGERAYFYQGPEAAREMLEGKVAWWLDDTSAWGGDVQSAAALRTSGLYVVRALRDLGEQERSDALMGRLAGVFVAQSVLGQRWPPEIAEAWEVARQTLASENAWITVAPQEGWECPLYVNGQQVHVKRLRVRPGERYVLSSQCDDPSEVEAPAMWSLGGLVAGEQVVGYWPEVHPEHAMGPTALKAMAITRDIGELVVVGEGGRCGASQTGGGGGACVWSSAGPDVGAALFIALDDPSRAHRALARALPAHYVAAGSPGQPVAIEAPADVAAPGAVAWLASSTLLAAGGAWLGWTLVESHRYSCSAQTGGTSWMSCEGTQAAHFSSEAERLASARSLNLQRLGASVTLGAGVAVLGALIVDRAGRGEPVVGPTSNDRIDIGVSAAGAGASLTLGGRF